jgi:hypothetical protein
MRTCRADTIVERSAKCLSQVCYFCQQPGHMKVHCPAFLGQYVTLIQKHVRGWLGRKIVRDLSVSKKAATILGAHEACMLPEWHNRSIFFHRVDLSRPHAMEQRLIAYQFLPCTGWCASLTTVLLMRMVSTVADRQAICSARRARPARCSRAKAKAGGGGGGRAGAEVRRGGAGTPAQELTELGPTEQK